LILYCGVLSLILALLRGGRIRRLGELHIRQMWLVFIPPAFMVMLIAAREMGRADIVRAVSGYLHLLAYCALLMLVWLNRRLTGAAFLAAGLLLNMAVLVANGGRMPVSYKAAEFSGVGPKALKILRDNDMTRHIIIDDRTRLGWLGDVIPIPKPPFPDPEVMSVGDALLAIGVFILIQTAMVPHRQRP